MLRWLKFKVHVAIVNFFTPLRQIRDKNTKAEQIRQTEMRLAWQDGKERERGREWGEWREVATAAAVKGQSAATFTITRRIYYSYDVDAKHANYTSHSSHTLDRHNLQTHTAEQTPPPPPLGQQ